MNISRTDKQIVTGIIAQSMGTLPGVKWIIGDNPRKLAKRLNALADFVFETAFPRNGIFLSSDRMGVAVLYRKDKMKLTLKDYWYRIKFVFNCIGLDRVLEMHKRECYIGSKRPVDGNYLFFWIFSVLPDARGLGAGIELKNIILQESARQQMPIYLETSNSQNKRVYERYGFRVYHEWFVPHRNFTLWFMKREP